MFLALTTRSSTELHNTEGSTVFEGKAKADASDSMGTLDAQIPSGSSSGWGPYIPSNCSRMPCDTSRAIWIL